MGNVLDNANGWGCAHQTSNLIRASMKRNISNARRLRNVLRVLKSAHNLWGNMQRAQPVSALKNFLFGTNDALPLSEIRKVVLKGIASAPRTPDAGDIVTSTPDRRSAIILSDI